MRRRRLRRVCPKRIRIGGFARPDCVIGGPGAFVIPVYDWSQFAGAVKRKLVLEIAAAPPLVWHAQATGPGGYDCMIGEKIWEQFRRYYSEP